MSRILVVDDEKQVREVMRKQLERAGHEAIEAADGDIAIKAHRDDPFDLVILDMYMPEKEGVETLVEMLTDYPELKIVAISGGGKRVDLTPLRVAGRLGAVRTLTKPIAGELLLACVEDVLSS